MPQQYTREQLRQLYVKLPQEIKDVASADETANDIEQICERNEISDERVGMISDLIRNVLFGLLLPEEFPEELEKETKLEKTKAKKIAQEINRFIFYPVKSALEQLYKIESASPQSVQTPKPETAIKPPEEYQTISKKDDSYREPIE